MRDVLLALILHVGVRLRVVITIGHTEPALHRVRDRHRAVLIVNPGTETEKRSHAH